MSILSTVLSSFQPVFVLRLMYPDKFISLLQFCPVLTHFHYLLDFSYLFHITQNVTAKDQDMELKYIIYSGR